MENVNKDDFLRDSTEEDYKKFENWYNSELDRFHQYQFDDKQIAYSSWLASRRDLINYITQDLK